MSHTGAVDESDDAAVIKESARDPERFAVIFDRHGPYIQRYLARRLGREMADDLLAETGDVNALGKDLFGLASESYLRPQSRAALFEAAAKIPGLAAVDDVNDAAGRPGIGISWSTANKGKPGNMILVFDPKTYAYLGTSDGDAVLETAIVDKVGRRP
jgi:hypothetical protein